MWHCKNCGIIDEVFQIMRDYHIVKSYLKDTSRVYRNRVEIRAETLKINEEDYRDGGKYNTFRCAKCNSLNVWEGAEETSDDNLIPLETIKNYNIDEKDNTNGLRDMCSIMGATDLIDDTILTDEELIKMYI
jgi:hypothetical protein